MAADHRGTAVITASTTDVVLAVLIAALGGSAVQAFRVRLDRRAAQAAAQARVYRRIRALLRRWPEGPPLSTSVPSGRRADDYAPDVSAFLIECAELTEDVAAAWPTDSLAYTLERLLDAISRLPAHPDARQATLNLYRVCSEHLVALDLGPLGIRGKRRLAIPVVGAALRTVREITARAELSRALPPLPHGLPPLPQAPCASTTQKLGPASEGPRTGTTTAPTVRR